jgi:hypothetical protein
MSEYLSPWELSITATASVLGIGGTNRFPAIAYMEIPPIDTHLAAEVNKFMGLSLGVNTQNLISLNWDLKINSHGLWLSWLAYLGSPEDLRYSEFKLFSPRTWEWIEDTCKDWNKQFYPEGLIAAAACYPSCEVDHPRRKWPYAWKKEFLSKINITYELKMSGFRGAPYSPCVCPTIVPDKLKEVVEVGDLLFGLPLRCSTKFNVREQFSREYVSITPKGVISQIIFTFKLHDYDCGGLVTKVVLDPDEGSLDIKDIWLEGVEMDEEDDFSNRSMTDFFIRESFRGRNDLVLEEYIKNAKIVEGIVDRVMGEEGNLEEEWDSFLRKGEDNSQKGVKVERAEMNPF